MTGTLLPLALAGCLLIASCRSSPLATSNAPAADANAVLARQWTTPPPGAERLQRSAVERLAAPTDDATPLGRGFAAPSSARRGIAGTRLRGSVAFRAPDVLDFGLFYPINGRVTVGLIGQHLVQERAAEIEGQLVDPTDFSSFISGFSIFEETTSLSFGPFAQVRLLDEQRVLPEIRLVGYALEWGVLTSASTEYSRPNLVVDGDPAASGDRADRYRSVFLSASKRLPSLFRSDFVRGVRAYGAAGWGMRTGKRYDVAETGSGDPRVSVRRNDITRHSLVGWIGAEVALPSRFSVYGEFFTGDECDAGYAFGLRWASPLGITFSIGVSNCFESIPQRGLDLAYLPGGVGGQPAVVTGGSGSDGGGVGFDFEDPDDEGPVARTGLPIGD